MKQEKAAFGMIGLGVMGRNLLLNIADHGFAVAGYDRDKDKVAALAGEGEGLGVLAAGSLGELIAALDRPRIVMLLVPAGDPVDAVLNELTERLSPEDIIIDGGNSHFSDTDRRCRTLAGRGPAFLGVGISGGEAGARHGPSIMPGGEPAAYEQVRPIFEAAAARVGDKPCVTWLGPGSAGHFVKMVHNGIEYGLMELIAEAYDLLRRGFGFDIPRLQSIFEGFGAGPLAGYLIDITAVILARRDEHDQGYLVDRILDEAAQKGTGMWTSREAMALQVPVPGIDTAVMMRDLSTFGKERRRAAQLLQGPEPQAQAALEDPVSRLEKALLAAFFMVYSQGMALLHRASGEYGYGLDLEAIARIWRGGCIIRAALLEDIRAAYRRRPDCANLLLDPEIGARVTVCADDLRAVVRAAAGLGIPAPGLMAALAYFDALRSAVLPANLIQAQRDYFGSHTYLRIDAEGTFHTLWDKD